MEKDIFLLASNEKNFLELESFLIEVDHQFEERMTGEFECEKILQALNEPRMKLYIIDCDTDDPGCMASNIHRLISRDLINKKLKIILFDRFGYEDSDKKVFLRDRIVRIRRRDFENKNLVKNMIRTLIDAPIVYVSYGNDKSVEMETQIRLLLSGADRVLPYIKFYIDRDIKYKTFMASEFLNKIKFSSYVVVLFNEKYFQSENCMQELLGLMDASDDSESFLRKIYPVVLESARGYIYQEDGMSDIVDFWKKKKEKSRSTDEIEFIERIINLLPGLRRIISNVWALKPDIIEAEKGLPLLWEINKQLERDGYVSFYKDDLEMLKILKEP